MGLGGAWAVVLASGGGQMGAVTRAVCGWDVPEAFAPLTGAETLLQQTLGRAATVAARRRTIVVAAEPHGELAAAQLASRVGVRLALQPFDVGTAPAALLGLCHVLVRDALAVVAVMPAHHHVERFAPFGAALARACELARRSPGTVALLGAHAEQPEGDLPWLVPEREHAPSRSGALPVHRIVVRPGRSMARLLLASRAYVGTNVAVASAATLWRLFVRQMPAAVREVKRYLARIGAPDADDVLVDVYRELLPADLTRELLAPAPDLVVVPVEGAGWVDCASPERWRRWQRSRRMGRPVLERTT